VPYPILIRLRFSNSSIFAPLFREFESLPVLAFPLLQTMRVSLPFSWEIGGHFLALDLLYEKGAAKTSFCDSPEEFGHENDQEDPCAH
jgi:hypothetical protein